MSFIFAVDVEDWAQSSIDASLPLYKTAEQNTIAMLELAENLGVKGTWFVLGLFAEQFPKVVREIYELGHEVACHGFGHLNVFDQSRDEFRADVARAKVVLEDIIGDGIEGYRAPFFSLAPAGMQALEVIMELGFTYDSSIFPSAMYQNGVEAAVNGPSIIHLPSGSSIVELPPATVSGFGRHWPVAGGGYHRLLPGFVTRKLVRKAISEQGVFTSYFHPYEIDPNEFSRIPVATDFKTRFHQGMGRRNFKQKLARLLKEQNCALARDIATDVWDGRFAPSTTAR